MPHASQHYDILDADEIQRVDVPDSNRTQQKDDAADYIEEMWPATLTDIAEEAGYSRQHIRNTLDTYFQPANHHRSVDLQRLTALANSDSASTSEQEDVEGVGVGLPGHERELLAAYRLGYRDGFQDGRDLD